MRPDAINPAVAREAVRLLRARERQPDVDDETLANLIEHGIESVPPDQRAPLLRAIGNSPEIASIIADLAPMAAAERAAIAPIRILGLPARAWRVAWAACALAAIGLTLWHVSAPMPGGAGITILDGGVDGPSQDFADSLHQSLRRKTVIMLWALLALLSAPALLSFRSSLTNERLQPARMR